MTNEQKLPEPTEVRPFTMSLLTSAYARELPLTEDGFFQGPTEGEVLRALYAFLADDPVRHALAILNAGGEEQIAEQLHGSHEERERYRQIVALAKVLACPGGSEEECADRWEQMHAGEQIEWESIAHRLIRLNYEGGAESLEAAADAAHLARGKVLELRQAWKGGSR
ncbi:hypothetical protein [Arthrobacter woluwensis]|uniref:hypothetical protein n=1 Tax=Arthrobacter woluwensis TaxID=156980 RepID=UPI003830A85E